MKKIKIDMKLLSFWILLGFWVSPLWAQGYGGPLTFQGVDNLMRHSAGSRATGGVSIGAQRDIGLMFQNPATLPTIGSIQVSLGGIYYSTDVEQKQNYAPVRYYPNLSLLFEGQTANIPNPDTTLFGFTAQDTVQRPYDDIHPNWSRSKSDNLPLQAMLAVPIRVGNFKIVAGLGAVEYANLNHYYQNNNVLSPGILDQRPLPILRPTDDNPLEVDWSKSVRSREGSINGYGFALAGSLLNHKLSLGFSGLFLQGSSDDYEQEVGRGHLTFFSNAFRIDSVYRTVTKTGTSDFSGQEFTISGILGGSYVSVGFAVKLPSTITRSYTMRVSTDTTLSPTISTVEGEDKLKIPWRGMIGLSLNPKENLRVGLEYEYRPYESVRYVNPEGTETSPWLAASLFHVGVEYRISSWLELRGGIRGEAEVFEPEGNKIEGEPVTFSVYSAGVGLFYSGFHLNVTYENSVSKYQDIWSSAISRNSERRHTVVAGLSYEIPKIW